MSSLSRASHHVVQCLPEVSHSLRPHARFHLRFAQQHIELWVRANPNSVVQRRDCFRVVLQERVHYCLLSRALTKVKVSEEL